MPNLVAIGQSVEEIWPFLIFFKMAAIRSIGFVIGILGPSTKTTWWSLSLCKIWLELIQQFQQRARFNILRVWLEKAYSCPKMEVL